MAKAAIVGLGHPNQSEVAQLAERMRRLLAGPPAGPAEAQRQLRCGQVLSWRRLAIVASRALTLTEVDQLADHIRKLLADPDAGLTEPMRQRWQGALTALEAVLGEPSSLVEGLQL